jgi:DNA-directed RNA polymerase subunit RPC12/RpoP
MMTGEHVPDQGQHKITQAKDAVVCPYCGSTETELFSLFGQQLLTVQYYCNHCRTPFEYIKDDVVLHDYAARKEGPL